ncbi:hypothetical protein AB0912_06170 [Streptomyces sp. NPDC007084]|uniref:hypothetical protein n=1 Tax=Streptomyces sp. NPDC007084 TaxID=3154313 RepID=UPI0034544D8F
MSRARRATPVAQRRPSDTGHATPVAQRSPQYRTKLTQYRTKLTRTAPKEVP